MDVVTMRSSPFIQLQVMHTQQLYLMLVTKPLCPEIVRIYMESTPDQHMLQSSRRGGESIHDYIAIEASTS